MDSCELQAEGSRRMTAAGVGGTISARAGWEPRLFPPRDPEGCAVAPAIPLLVSNAFDYAAPRLRLSMIMKIVFIYDARSVRLTLNRWERQAGKERRSREQ